MPDKPAPRKPEPSITIKLGKATIRIPADAALTLLTNPDARRALRTQLGR